MAKVTIYTDGSFEEGIGVAGWGFVAVKENGEIEKMSGVTSKNIESRNVSGELKAVKVALQWCFDNEINDVLICHDYTGVAFWADGSWKANKDVSIDYVDVITEATDLMGINVKFKKIKAHSGNEYNEIADKLANNAIKEYVKAMVSLL